MGVGSHQPVGPTLMEAQKARYFGLRTSRPDRLGPYYIEVVEDRFGPGILREVSTYATGAVRGKKPDERDDHPSIFRLPNIEEALRTGEMWEINRDAFEDWWAKPVFRQSSMVARIVSAVGLRLRRWAHR